MGKSSLPTNINVNEIVSFIKNSKISCTERDLKERFAIDGYYMGVMDNRVILYTGSSTINSVWLRPYHIKFLVELKNPVILQKISLINRGIRRSRNGDTGPKDYYHVDINTHLDFIDLPGFEIITN